MFLFILFQTLLSLCLSADPTLIYVVSFNVTKTDSCTTDGISKIILETDFEPSGEITAVINDDNKEYQIGGCSISKTPYYYCNYIECTDFKGETFNYGKYWLKSVTESKGDYIFNISLVEKSPIEYTIKTKMHFYPEITYLSPNQMYIPLGAENDVAFPYVEIASNVSNPDPDYTPKFFRFYCSPFTDYKNVYPDDTRTNINWYKCYADDYQLPTKINYYMAIYITDNCKKRVPIGYNITKGATATSPNITITVRDISFDKATNPLCGSLKNAKIKLTTDVNASPNDGITIGLTNKNKSIEHKSDSCVVEENTIICTMNNFDGFPVDNALYYLSSVTSKASFNNFVVPESIKTILLDYKPTIYSYKNYTLTNNKETDSFSFTIFTGVSSLKVYTKDEMGNLIDINCDIDDTTVICHPNSTNMPDNRDYYIYTSNKCGDNEPEPSGQYIRRAYYPIPTVQGMTLFNGDTCTTENIDGLKVIFSGPIYGTVATLYVRSVKCSTSMSFYSTMTKGRVLVTEFNINQSRKGCSYHFERGTLVYGDLSEDKEEKYIVTHAEDYDPISSYNGKEYLLYQLISKKLKTFQMELLDYSSIPVYVGDDRAKLLECNTNNKTMICIANETVVDLTQSLKYTIHYENVCKKLVPSVNVIGTVIPSDVHCKSDSKCSTSFVILSYFYIKTDEDPGNITSVIVSNENEEEVQYPCTPDSAKSIYCDFKGQFPNYGTYKLKTIVGTHNYLGLEDFQMKYIKNENPIDENQNSIDITILYSKFTILLKSEELNPLFYLEEKEDSLVNCEKKLNTLSCTLDKSIDLTQENSYKLYYKDGCDSFQSTNVYVNVIAPSHIAIDSVSWGDDSKCIIDNPSEIKITVAEIPKVIVNAIVTRKSDNAEISFNSCIINELIITCTGPSTPLTKDTYTLTALNGLHYYDIDPSKEYTLDYSSIIEPLSPNVIKKQEVNRKKMEFTIALINEDTELPLFFYEEDESKKLDCYKENSNAICKTNFTIIPETKDYTIYYKGTCNKLYSTNIILTNYISITTDVDYISINDNKCSALPFNEFTIYLKEAQGKEVTKATLIQNNGNLIQFEKCESKEEIIICSEPDKEIEEGTFKLSSIEGINYFSISSMSSNEIKYQKETLAEIQSETSPIINAETFTFNIDLFDENSNQPSIYIENNISKKLSCIKENSILTCNVNSTIMPETKKYELYYYPACSESLQPVGITVNNILPIEIEVLNFFISDNTICSTTFFDEILISINKKPTVSIKSAVIQKEENKVDFIFPICELIDDLTIKCSGNKIEEDGYYTLSSISSEDDYVVNRVSTIKIKIDHSPNQIKEDKQNRTQTVHKEHQFFNIIIEEKDAESPLVYIDKEGKEKFDCSFEDTLLKCKANQTIFPENKEYQIYYKGICDKIISTGITVHNIIPETINVTKMRIKNNDNEQCSQNIINEIELTVDSFDAKEVNNIVLAQGINEIVFQKCITNDNIVTCSEPDKEMNEGVYKLKKVNGIENYFDISQIEQKDPSNSLGLYLNEIKYQKEPLAESQNQLQTIDKNTFSFIIQLASSYTIAPKVFVKETNKEIQCIKNNNKLICYPTDNEMPETEQYEILYIAACDVIKSTGITINHVLTSTIKVIDFYLENNILCTLDIFTSFIIKLNNIPKGKIITYAVLKKIENDKLFYFTSCDIKDTTVICSSPTTQIEGGTYSLSSIEGDDTYSVASVLSKKIIFDNTENPLGQQNISQTIDGENLNFTLILRSEETESPLIYIGSTITKNKKVNCERNNNNKTELICSPSNVNIPSKGIYEIYYIGNCGLLFNSGIVVTYTPPITINVIKFNNGINYCSAISFNSFSFAINTKPTGKINSVLLQNVNDSSIYTFTNCSIDNKIVTCSSKEISSYGSYVIKEVKGVDTYIINADAKSNMISIESDPLAKPSKTEFDINLINKEFSFSLVSKETKIPKLISEKEIQCDKDINDERIAICSIKDDIDINMKNIEIKYKGPCGEILSSGITVSSNFKSITVTNISLSDNCNCKTDSIDEILISIDNDPSGEILTASIIDENKNIFSFNDCDVNRNVMRCKTEFPITVDGSYKLHSISGADYYDIKTNEKMHLKRNKKILGDQINSNPIIDENTTTIIVILDSEETEPPTMYIDEDIELKCEQKGNELECNVDYIESSEVEVYYKDDCGNNISTGIIVQNPRWEMEYKNNEKFLRLYNIILVGIIFVILL